MWTQLIPAFRMMLVLTVATGLLYPAAVTLLCQGLFRDQANGSLVQREGKVVGSALLGQNFKKPIYFHSRPSGAGADGYDASASSGTNLGPTNQKLIERVKVDAAKFRQENPGYTGAIPADALTTSGSGLDPHISPAFAEAQAARVAQARGVGVDGVRQLVASHVETRKLGIFGEPRVNVLQLNLDLDRQFPQR